MKANVFHAPRHSGLEEKLIPKPGPAEALMQMRLTTICNTGVQIVNGESPLHEGLTVDRELSRRSTRLRISGRRGIDVATEALGFQETFERALPALRPGETLLSVGVHWGYLKVPLDAFGAGQRDQTIVTTLCPAATAS